MGEPLKSRKLKIVLSAVTVLIITPLILYSNCGSVEETTQTQSQQTSDPNVHQKIFIDIAGEHLDPNELNTNQENSNPDDEKKE